jgi:predicted phosphoribosyltransferase
MFRNRTEAGMLLALRLQKYQNDPGVILAVPRGGVPVAYEVAKELGFPLEVILTKKIGHPMNPEYAIGAASLSDYFVVPHDIVSQDYIDNEVLKIRKKVKEMYVKFMGNKEPEDLKGKTVIVIDDGVATGNTLLSTIDVIRKSDPAKIVIAVPVAPESAVSKLSKAVDDVVVVMIPESFYGVGSFYEDFEQVNDEEVIYYLNKLREFKKAG